MSSVFKNVGLPDDDGRVPFKMFGDTIVKVPIQEIHKLIDYFNRRASLADDCKINIRVSGSCNGIRLIFENGRCLSGKSYSSLPENIEVTTKVTVGELLDELRRGWIIV